MDEAIAALKAAGRDRRRPSTSRAWSPRIRRRTCCSRGQSSVLSYGMKRDFNTWLASLGPAAPVKTLTELREWNTAHEKLGTIKYGQAQLDASDKIDLEKDSARYEEDRARDIRVFGTNGIDAAMKANNLDALLFPGPEQRRHRVEAGLSDRARAVRDDSERSGGRSGGRGGAPPAGAPAPPAAAPAAAQRRPRNRHRRCRQASIRSRSPTASDSRARPAASRSCCNSRTRSSRRPRSARRRLDCGDGRGRGARERHRRRPPFPPACVGIVGAETATRRALVLLLADGWRILTARPEGLSLAVGLALLLTSVLVLGSVIRSLRHQVRRRGEAHGLGLHHGIDWVDIFLAAMLAAEAFAHWHETGHIRRPTVLTAMVMLALGCLHGPLTARHHRRRTLRVDDRGLNLGGRWGRRFTAAWEDIARVDLDEGNATIVRTDGAIRRINLSDLQNAREVSAVLEGVRARVIDRPIAAAGSA